MAEFSELKKSCISILAFIEELKELVNTAKYSASEQGIIESYLLSLDYITATVKSSLKSEDESLTIRKLIPEFTKIIKAQQSFSKTKELIPLKNNIKQLISTLSTAFDIFKKIESELYVLSRQYSMILKLSHVKKINLTVIYQVQNPLSVRTIGRIVYTSPFDKIKEYSQQVDDSVNNVVYSINEEIAQAVTSAFRSKNIEGMLGKTFKKNVIVYIVSVQELVGFVSKLKKIFRKNRHMISIEILPDLNNIRMFIPVEYMFYTNKSELASTILHETVHLFDVYVLRKYTEVARFKKRGISREDEKFYSVLFRSRIEGLAVFSQWVDNPYSLIESKLFEFNTWMVSHLSDKKSIVERKNIEYKIGSFIMLQLFLNMIKQPDEKDAVTLQKYLKDYKKHALTLINIIRFMNYKRFFEYYADNVKNTIISRDLLNKIIKDAPDIKLERAVKKRLIGV